MESIKGNLPSEEEVLKFQIKRNITFLFKAYLEMVEDLIVEHDAALNKLEQNLPPEYKKYVNLADHLTDEKCENLRKRIIDRGNDCRRNLEEVLKQFEIRMRE